MLISSAFSDHAEELRILHEEVFPRLRELCRRHGWRLQLVDLTRDTGLQEIVRCAPSSGFIGLLDGPGGNLPLPESIPAAEFTRIEACVPASSASFLREWYRPDSNAAAPVCLLQKPTGVFSQADTWERFVAAPLRTLLAGAVRSLNLAPEDRLKYEAPAADQELRFALSGKEGAPVHVFCCALAGAGGPAQLEREALKKQLRQQLAANYIEYKSPATLAAGLTTGLTRSIQAEIKRREKVAPADSEEAAHEEFRRERARHFTGRAKAIERIAEYLHGANPAPLVVTGAPGSGMSALLAHSVERYRTLRSDAAVIYRAVGATAESLDGRALLADVCRRLGSGAVQRTGYADLIEQLPERLAAWPARGPVVIILDGLDQWPADDLARDLDWLPLALPAGVRLMVSAASGGDLLPGLRKKVPGENVVELEPMTAEEAGRLLEFWLGEVGRGLSAAQWKHVLEGFRLCPLPLYLRLTFSEARHWASYEPVRASSSPPDLAGQIDAVLGRLVERHGRTLVSRCLGFLAAARQGLAEDELFDLLAVDGTVTAAAWPRLCADLRPYLIERMAGGVTLLAFAHREFADAVAQTFLAGDERRARHLALALYFAESGYPARRLAELVRQQVRSGLWPQVEETLTSFEFVEAKTRAGLLRDLMDDHRIAEARWRKEKGGPPPWLEWSRFLAAEAQTIEARIAEYPQIVFQQAFNQSREGRISQSVHVLMKQGRGPQQAWFERVNRPELPPGRACLAKLEGHSGAVSAVALAAGGALAVSGGVDGTVRVWRLSTGACLRVFRGHTSGIMALLITGADRDRVVSASWDSTVRVWDLNTGRCLQVLGGEVRPVASLAAMGPDRVAAGGADGSLRFWEVASGRCLATLRGHRDRINSLLAIPGGRIASASDDGSVHIWGEDGSSHGALTGHGGPVLHLSWIAGALSASCRSGKILLWDLETGKVRDILSGHRGPVAGSAALDAARVVSWSYDHTLRLWSLVDGSQLLVMQRHQAPVTSVARLADGRLVSASQDSTLRLWDPGGECLGVLAGHRSWVSAVTSGAAGAVSASRDGSLRIWDLDAVRGEVPRQPVETPPEIARSQELVGVYVVDENTAISLTNDPEWLQVWNLPEGRAVQSAAGSSEAGRQLRQRISAGVATLGPSYCGKPPMQWGFAIRRADEPASGIALTRARQCEDGSFEYKDGVLAFYPLECRPCSSAFECDYAIGFDAQTREPHVLKAHHDGLAAAESEEAQAPSGGLRSFMRRLWGRGDNP